MPEYRVVAGLDQRAGVLAHAIVDLTSKRVTLDLPGGTRTTIDVVTARAVSMLLAEIVYGPLGPRDRTCGWSRTRETAGRPVARPDDAATRTGRAKVNGW